MKTAIKIAIVLWLIVGLAWPSLAVADEPATENTPAESDLAPGPGLDRGRLVFQEATGGALYTVNADGSDLQPVGQGISPTWAPDGRRIAFARWDYPPGIYVMNADGSEVARLADVENALGLVWSPDGRQIAFYAKYLGQKLIFDFNLFQLAWKDDDQWKLTVLDVDTRQLLDLPREWHAFSPTWAPDSMRVAYKGDRGLYTTEWGGESRLIPRTDTRFVSPAWSPSGDRIAFMWRQHDHWEIGTIHAEGGDFKLLTTFKPFTRAADNVAPTWSPDGEEIAFLSNREGDWRIYVMAADGSDQRKLSDAPVQYEYVYERALSWVGPSAQP